MDLKPIFTTKPANYDHEKVKQAVLAKINIVSLDMPGKSYGLHSRIIDSVKKIQDKHNFPIGIIHAIHPDADDLDMQMAVSSGVHAISTSSLHPVHLKRIKYHAKKYGIPVLAQIDREPANEEELKKLVDGFILQSKYLRLFDFKADKKKTALAKNLLDFAIHSDAVALAVGDLELARILSAHKSPVKLVFVSGNREQLSRSCLLHKIIPVALKGTVMGSLSHKGVVARGQRVINAASLKKGVTIELGV